jgi:signal transduction histidine kinase
MELNKKNQNILIIDDNTKNLQVAMNILNQEGYHLLYAQNGMKGLELVKKYEISLILLDILMPTMDGYEVCKELKKSSQTKDIPIIFLTVKDEERDIVKGFVCGGVDYVTKPFYATVLLKRVETHLRLLQTTKELQRINQNLAKEIERQVQNVRVKEQILFQQSKMASMGEMIANIAHQWRQPLSAISMTIIGLKTKLALEGFDFDKKEGVQACQKEIEEKFDDISNYVLNLSDTMESFKNFFKPEQDMQNFNLAKIIRKSLNLLNANLQNKNIEIVSSIEDIELRGFENAFSQVIINILNNARDALIENKTEGRRLIFITVKDENGFVYISIKDNAGGIKEKIIERIFEPYFTTKHQSNGTGIGLYMTQEIIHKHMNGEIFVNNLSYVYEGYKYRGAEFVVQVSFS